MHTSDSAAVIGLPSETFPYVRDRVDCLESVWAQLQNRMFETDGGGRWATGSSTRPPDFEARSSS